MTGPYGDNANDYVAAGWRGVLPLPQGEKYPPPTGYTGAGGAWPSGADVWAWTEERPEANIGLRLPPIVLGLDVDAYGLKRGAETLAAATEKFGPLPATWSVTSRGTGASRIHLFRVEPGRYWPGEVGPGVEVIQSRHRYVVAPPSIHPEGRTYRWDTPGGGPGPMPSPDDLPPLPETWVQGLSGGRAAIDITKAQPGDINAAPWYMAARQNTNPCGMVRTTVTRAVADLRDAHTSRHDVGMKAVMRLCYLSTEGHTGVVVALDQIRDAWYRAVTTGTSARDDASATREWQRMMAGALAVLAADGGLDDHDLPDPCANPLAGLLMPADDPPGDDRAFTYDPDAGTYSPPEPATTVVDPPTPEQVEAAMAHAIAAEAIKIRIRQAARRLVAAEDAAASWAPPEHRHNLTDELDLPDELIPFRVDDVIPAGANVVLTAAFKAGKTTMVDCLVRSLVDGMPFLGRYTVHPKPDARVGIWNYEVGGSQYRRWLRDLGIRNTDAVSVLNLRGHRMPVVNPYVQEWVVKWLADHKIKTWIVDPFARAFIGNGENENSNADVGIYLDTLDQIKEMAGVEELIIPAHTGRVEMDIGAERARGASRLDDWADVRWILTKDEEGTRYFRASGRDVETPEGTLEYDLLTRDLTLVDGGREKKTSERGARPEDLAACIVESITLHPGVSLRGIRQWVKGQGVKAGSNRIDEGVARLAGQRLIMVSPGGPGRPTGHYLAVGGNR